MAADPAITKRIGTGKAGRIVIFTALFLVAWILTGASPALAGRSDCFFASCGFGPLYEGPLSFDPGPTFDTIGTTTFTENIYKGAASPFAYLYTITSTNVGSTRLTQFETWTMGYPVSNRFDPNLPFGVVYDGFTTPGVSVPGGGITVPPVGASAYYGASGIVGSDGVDGLKNPTIATPGDTITLYGESFNAPYPGSLQVCAVPDSGCGEPVRSIDPAPEPSTGLLLGLALPIFAVVGGVRARRRGRARLTEAALA